MVTCHPLPTFYQESLVTYPPYQSRILILGSPIPYLSQWQQNLWLR